MEGFNLLYFSTIGAFIGLVLGCAAIILPRSLRGMRDDLVISVLCTPLLLLFFMSFLQQVLNLDFQLKAATLCK